MAKKNNGGQSAPKAEMIDLTGKTPEEIKELFEKLQAENAVLSQELKEGDALLQEATAKYNSLQKAASGKGFLPIVKHPETGDEHQYQTPKFWLAGKLYTAEEAAASPKITKHLVKIKSNHLKNLTNPNVDDAEVVDFDDEKYEGMTPEEKRALTLQNIRAAAKKA